MANNSNKPDYEARIQVVNHEKLLFLVFSLIQKLVDDERPEVYVIDHLCVFNMNFLFGWYIGATLIYFLIAIKFPG